MSNRPFPAADYTYQDGPDILGVGEYCIWVGDQNDPEPSGVRLGDRKARERLCAAIMAGAPEPAKRDEAPSLPRYGMIDSASGRAYCMWQYEHESHRWAYTSEGGGHMAHVGEPGDYKNYKEWDCPGKAEPSV